MADNKVMLVDGHALVRAGIRKLLEADGRVEVSEEAGDGEECIAKVQVLAGRPDAPKILLLEICLLKMDGFEVLRKVKEAAPDMGVLILTVREEPKCLLRAVEMGADGYLSKDCSLLELKTAIRTVFYGKKYIQPKLLPLLQNRKMKCYEAEESRKRKWNSLTAREREVLAYVADGMLNKEIAFSMDISEQTVKNHLSNIFRKLDVMDRTQAAVLALEGHMGERFLF